MPKQKSSKKKTGKIKRVVSLLKPNTPLKGLLLFVLVFALIGGGYAIKRSFAFAYDQGVKDIYGNPSARTVVDDLPGKSPVYAWELDGGNSGIVRSDFYIAPNLPHNLNFCYRARVPLNAPTNAYVHTHIYLLNSAKQIVSTLREEYDIVYKQSDYGASYCTIAPVAIPAGAQFVGVDLWNGYFQGKGYTSSRLHVLTIGLRY